MSATSLLHSLTLNGATMLPLASIFSLVLASLLALTSAASSTEAISGGVLGGSA